MPTPSNQTRTPLPQFTHSTSSERRHHTHLPVQPNLCLVIGDCHPEYHDCRQNGRLAPWYQQHIGHQEELITYAFASSFRMGGAPERIVLRNLRLLGWSRTFLTAALPHSAIDESGEVRTCGNIDLFHQLERPHRCCVDVLTVEPGRTFFGGVDGGSLEARAIAQAAHRAFRRSAYVLCNVSEQAALVPRVAALIRRGGSARGNLDPTSELTLSRFFNTLGWRLENRTTTSEARNGVSRPRCLMPLPCPPFLSPCTIPVTLARPRSRTPPCVTPTPSLYAQSDKSPCEQLKMWTGASLFVSPHGQQWASALFAPRGSLLVEASLIAV